MGEGEKEEEAAATEEVEGGEGTQGMSSVKPTLSQYHIPHLTEPNGLVLSL